MDSTSVQAISLRDLEIFSIYCEDSKNSRLTTIPQRSLVGEVREEDVRGLPWSRRCFFISTCACIGVFSIVLFLIVLPVVVLKASLSESADTAKETLLLEDILDENYSPRWFNGTWESDTEFSYMSKEGQVFLHDMETLTSSNLILNDTLIPAKKFRYSLSPDHKYLLVSYNSSKRFRHIYASRYSIVDLEAQSSTVLQHNGEGGDKGLLQLASWSTVGNSIVYVYRNNIYYRPAAYSNTEFAITSDGIVGVVYNGATDWIYYDAVLSTNAAMWFSNNGTRLAFASFNDSMVKTEPIVVYGDANKPGSQYTQTIHLRYPKSGSKNPRVALHVVDLETLAKEKPSIVTIPAPKNLSEPILAAVTWANNEEVVVLWKNRVQNKIVMEICNCTKLKCSEAWKEETKDGWTDIFSPPRFSEDGTRMLILSPQEQEGGIGKYRHLTLIERDADGGESRVVALTAGTFTVSEVLAWDEENNIIMLKGTENQYRKHMKPIITVDQIKQCPTLNFSYRGMILNVDSYFTATEEDDPSRGQMFAVTDQFDKAPYVADCITCNFQTVNGGIPCKYSSAYFSYSNSFYVYQCVGPDIPEVSFFNKDHDFLTMWDDNLFLRDRLFGKAAPRVIQTKVPVPDGEFAMVKMWLPPHMDPNTKYPLLVDVYAGPDSRQVSERFEIDWRWYLTTNRSIVYAVIDGRGSGQRGYRTMFSLYRNFGSVEVEDQVTVTKHLLEEFKFLDKHRTAIWGWSYGGYSTLMTLIKDDETVFKCGIAVAPVTDWAYYTSVYTERHMGLPTKEDNLIGYQKANVNDKVELLRNKSLFLIHGTFDNIALYQNSMMLARALQLKNIQFKQQSYPDEDHALIGVLHHLYQSMLSFLEECYATK